MPSDLTLFIGLIILGIAILVWYRRNESKRLKQRTYEAMSPELRSEIDEERRSNIDKKKKFEEAMKKAGGDLK